MQPDMENKDEILDRIASGLYNLASMLVGEGEKSAELVEQTISSSEVKLCCCPTEARKTKTMRTVGCKPSSQLRTRPRSGPVKIFSISS